jgi:hypothetical protein
LSALEQFCCQERRSEREQSSAQELWSLGMFRLVPRFSARPLVGDPECASP